LLWIMLMSAVLIIRKILNENEVNSVLGSSRDNLQECTIKNREFHLRN